MMYDYLIVTRKPDYRFADNVSQLMYLFAILAFGYFYYNKPDAHIYLFMVAGITATWSITIIKKKKFGIAFFRFGLLLASAGWFFGSEKNIWMGMLYSVAAVLERHVKFPKEIGFSRDEISFNSFPRKVVNWNDVNNVVIKDGLITIDQKNNKIYQQEIQGEVTPTVEKEFNEFCRECISTRIINSAE